MSECVELPARRHLLLTVGWNAAESFGLPVAGYVIASSLGGRDAGLWAMLAAVWVTAGLRKLITGHVPGLIMIAMVVLTIQTAAAIATGNLLVFLLHFPIANLALCILFAWTARGHSPIAARLAAEVIGLRCPAIHQPRLHSFFQRVTLLWAGIFLLLAVSLGVLLGTVPISTYVPVWAATTVVLIAAGVGASVLWLRSVLRRFSIGLRFAQATPV
jgi:hypothetical protein